MGMINFGIPKKIALDLSLLHGVSVFVETGTYHGETARWAAEHFEFVHTVEQSESYFESHCEALSELAGVKSYCADSRVVFPEILSSIGDRKALHWLDSHWFGGETAGEKDQCPLLGELACLAERHQDIILIDDARLFLAAPPMPHNPAQWPTIADIVMTLPECGRRSYVQVADDVIFIIPNEESLKARLLAYTKRRNNLFWQDYLKLHNKTA